MSTAIQHVHQLHAVLLGVSHLRSRSEVHRSRAIALAQRYNLDSRDEALRSASRSVRARGHLGLHVRGRVREVCTKNVNPAAPSSATS